MRNTLKCKALIFKALLSLLLFSSFLYAKPITISYDPDYAPFSYSIEGKPYGLFIDIWKLWAKKNRYDLSFIQAEDWDDALELAKDAKVDFFLGTTPYEEWMQGSQSFYKTKATLFFLKTFNETITTVGIIGTDYKQDLQTNLPNVKIISYKNYTQLLQALIQHKVNAIYDDTIAISYYSIKNKYIHLIKESNTLVEISSVKAISMSKENIALFNKGVEKLSLHDLEALEKEWVSDKNMRYYNNSSFLKKRQFSYVFDPDWKPFEYKDKMSHVHMGIIADILSLISTKSGLTFTPIKTNTWAESVKLAKEKKVDMMSAVPWTEERDKYLNFTKNSIYSYPAVLVSNKNSTLTNDFSNVTIGIVKGNSLGEWVKDKYKDANFVFFNSVKEGFEALQNNKIDLFGINGVSANYYINIVGFSDTKISIILDYMFHLKIAFLKNIEPEVLSLVDEALSNITQKDRSDIYHKWTSIQVKKEINWKLLISVTTIAFIIVMIFILINKRLNKLVQERTAELKILNDNLESKVEKRTEELAHINKKMQDNIEYASLIQNSILPDHRQLEKYFQEHFIIWEPKDIVGGDIYFFEKINDDEALIILIDCTGHGVSGAFVTMLVKAIKEQLVSLLDKETLSPSFILKYFNQSFKKLLKQENSSSNVGFDAGVIHINKHTNRVTFSGANIPLYYISNEELHLLKADRHSVGYESSKDDFNYTQHEIDVKEKTTFYISSDGFIDQNGGKNSFPFGKKRFSKLLLTHHNKSLHEQKKILLESLSSYQADEERNDDITFISFSIEN